MSTVKFAWDAPASGPALGYKIFRSNGFTGPGSGYLFLADVATPPTDAAPFVDDTVPNDGRTRYYVVAAEYAGGVQSGFSNELAFTSAAGVPLNFRIVP